MNDLVSIITPSYNTEKYIKETINSVLSQSYKNWELFIVDDNSSDNSIEQVKKYADERIKLIINSQNFGAAICRNIGINKANGKWIAFLDSDDLWETTKLEKQIKFMQNNGIDFSYTQYSEINEQSLPLNIKNSGPKIINERKMRNYCYPGCLTVIYNQDKIGKINITDLPKNNDYALWLKVVKHANCYLYPEVLAHYRVRKNSLSNTSYFRLIRHHFLLWRKSENNSISLSIFRTINNLFFGVIKKIFYEKKIKYK
jgi:glycosyltransferase involved in cell wall biosynthesis